jgi:class 3 adenylate cyclase
LLSSRADNEATLATGPSEDVAAALDRKALPFGTLTFFGAGISLIFCYGQVLISLLAPLFGLATFELDIHWQAVFMWGFGLITVAGLVRDRKRHGRKTPLFLGIGAVAMIAATLYTYYDVRILIMGYVLMFVAALLNQIQMLGNLTGEVMTLNGTLTQRVEAQVAEIEQLARLKRFLSSEVAELITTEGNEGLLESHRRLIACLFGDIRNFTAFSEVVEPEDVMKVLQGVHEKMDRLIAERGGTIAYRAGDGLLVVFNDPLPCEAPVHEAAGLALEMCDAFSEFEEKWRQLGHELGFGIGIAYGYATLGLIGSEGRYDYTAIGNVVNIAARLSDVAKGGQILIDKRGYVEIEDLARTESIGLLDLKGVGQQVEAYQLLGLDTTA